jgi:hypothetical protein
MSQDRPVVLRPRVVILDGHDEQRVEVLVLPERTDLGSSFDHDGLSWRVTGERTGSRVLIAKPLS